MAHDNSYAMRMEEINLNESRTSHNSSVTLGGSSYPVGSRIGTSGMFVIGDPGGPHSTSLGTASVKGSHATLNTSYVSQNIIEERSYAYDFEDWNWPIIRFACLIALFAVMSALMFTTVGLSVEAKKQCVLKWEWWQGGLMYHVNVPYFHDSDQVYGGDIVGIKSQVPYLKWLGVKSVVLSFVLDSLINDWSMAIAYDKLNNKFGNDAEFDNLLAELRDADIHVLLEVRPVYTSYAHKWFKESEVQSSKSGNKYRDFYVWSEKAGSTKYGEWTKSLIRNEFYLHERGNATDKPLLNWKSEALLAEFADNLLKWHDRNVDGFYVTGLEDFYDSDEHRIAYILKYLRQHLKNSIIMISNDYFIDRQLSHKTQSEILEQVDVVDILIDVKGGQANVDDILSQVNKGRALTKQANHFWPSWRLRSLQNIPASHLQSLNLLLLTLPGTPGVVAGYEVGRDMPVMTKNKKIIPLGWKVSSGPVSGLNKPNYASGKLNSIDIIRNYLLNTVQNPALHSLPRDISGASWLETKSKFQIYNHKPAKCDTNCLILFLRSFEYRNSYLIAVNFGSVKVKENIANLLSVSSGEVIIDTDGKLEETIQFNDLTLESGSGLIAMLPL